METEAHAAENAPIRGYKRVYTEFETRIYAFSTGYIRIFNGVYTHFLNGKNL